jgi:hypothetical protein
MFGWSQTLLGVIMNDKIPATLLRTEIRLIIPEYISEACRNLILALVGGE